MVDNRHRPIPPIEELENYNWWYFRHIHISKNKVTIHLIEHSYSNFALCGRTRFYNQEAERDIDLVKWAGGKVYSICGLCRKSWSIRSGRTPRLAVR
jgi:hypothetical protein